MNLQKNTTLGFQLYSSAIYLAAQFLLIYISVAFTGGKLIYTLDDPYIHLALAESILEGGYGINSGEYASPSSSILYPFLLAVGLFVGLGEFGPLILSVLSSFLSVWVLSGFIWRVSSCDDGRTSIVIFLLMGPAILLAINAVALPMTGMENSIHVFGTILALTGLYRLATDTTRGTAIYAVVVGTLICATIRFEGLALAIAMCASLYALGYRPQAFLTAACVTAILAVYATFMTSLGLPIFPSSVMVHSNIVAQASDGNAFGLLKGLLSNTWKFIHSRWGDLMALASIAFLAVLLSTSLKQKRIWVLFSTYLFVLSAHIVAGGFGYGRYEVYAVAVMLIGCVSIPSTLFRSTAVRFVLPMALFAVGAPYLWHTVKAPLASQNIYQQQYQMHRFVQEFSPGRVGVNDLGYVAFGNDNYVLDLWGLGSEEARRLSRNNQWTPELLNEITLRHDIDYAMIYDMWFRDVPAGWCRVGNLVTSKVTSASDTVSFYLIERDREEEMRVALEAFAAELPDGARMDMFDCGT